VFSCGDKIRILVEKFVNILEVSVFFFDFLILSLNQNTFQKQNSFEVFIYFNTNMLMNIEVSEWSFYPVYEFNRDESEPFFSLDNGSLRQTRSQLPVGPLQKIHLSIIKNDVG